MNVFPERTVVKRQTCRVCGQFDDAPCYTVREMMFGTRHEFTYFQCARCECLQIETIPDDVSQYYPSNYYSLSQNDQPKFRGLAGWFRRNAIQRMLRNQTLLDKVFQKLYSPISLRVLGDLQIRTSTRILDVGCGSGHKFLYPLAELNYKHILGCDPFIHSPIQYANGLQIVKEDIFGMTGEWDIITYHHAFEHTPSPQENLNKVSELLQENGVCILRIPTVSSYAWKHYGVDWFQIDAPRHYFLHSVQSVRYMAEKSGLELFRVSYDSTHKQFTESERYASNESLRSPRKRGMGNFIKRKLAKIKYQRMAVYLNERNQGDQAAFYLRKPQRRVSGDYDTVREDPSNKMRYFFLFESTLFL